MSGALDQCERGWQNERCSPLLLRSAMSTTLSRLPRARVGRQTDIIILMKGKICSVSRHQRLWASKYVRTRGGGGGWMGELGGGGEVRKGREDTLPCTLPTATCTWLHKQLQTSQTSRRIHPPESKCSASHFPVSPRWWRLRLGCRQTPVSPRWWRLHLGGHQLPCSP